MICLLVMPLSIFDLINDRANQNVNEALISILVFLISLVMAYVLNKPKSDFVIERFYTAKWLTSLSTLFVTAISLALILALEVIGLALSFGILVLVLKFVVSPLWRCPACHTKLPYLSRGKSGFSIKECPNCDAVLSKS